VKAPVKEPHKNALRLLDKLFTMEEMSVGILFNSQRSAKRELDQERVKKMFGKHKSRIKYKFVITVGVDYSNGVQSSWSISIDFCAFYP